MHMSESPDDNLRRAIAGVRDAASKGAQLVCLPELFRSRYFCQSESNEHFALAEAVPGPTTKALEPLVTELGITLIASLFEQRAPGLYHNTAAVLDAGAGYLGKYRKMHIPDDPRYYEKFYFTPGDLGFKAFPTRVGKIGVLVCWDQWYPEAARLTALAGAEMLFYPTAIGWHPEERRGSESRAARRVGNRAARPRDRERLLCGGGESHRLRTRPDRQRRHQLLGAEFRGGARRFHRGAGVERSR